MSHAPAVHGIGRDFPACASSLFKDLPLPLTPEQLSSMPLLSHRVVPQDWFDWPEAIGRSRPANPKIIYFDSYPLVLQAAVAGQGVALG